MCEGLGHRRPHGGRVILIRTVIRAALKRTPRSGLANGSILARGVPHVDNLGVDPVGVQQLDEVLDCGRVWANAGARVDVGGVDPAYVDPEPAVLIELDPHEVDVPGEHRVDVRLRVLRPGEDPRAMDARILGTRQVDPVHVHDVPVCVHQCRARPSRRIWTGQVPRRYAEACALVVPVRGRAAARDRAAARARWGGRAWLRRPTQCERGHARSNEARRERGKNPAHRLRPSIAKIIAPHTANGSHREMRRRDFGDGSDWRWARTVRSTSWLVSVCVEECCLDVELAVGVLAGGVGGVDVAGVFVGG